MKPSLPAGSPPTPDLFPSLPEVLRYFTGVMELMTGRPEGLRRLDLSADGFWRSFAALPVALPPTVLSWIEFEHVERRGPRSEFAIYGAHALADLAAWLFPILILMLLARPTGFSRKIVPLIVSLNWGGAFLAWTLAPLWLLLLVFGGNDATTLLGAAALFAAIVLTARMVATATASDLLVAGAIVIVLLVCSFVAYAAVADLMGVTLA